MSNVGFTTETHAERGGSALAEAQRMKKCVMGSFGDVTAATPTASEGSLWPSLVGPGLYIFRIWKLFREAL